MSRHKTPENGFNRRISINSVASRPNSQMGFRSRLSEGKNSNFRKFSVLAHSKRQSNINDITITAIEQETSKDTRPLNRKSYQTQCIGELISYLRSQNFMTDIQRKDLNPASNKDFQDIFKFLYSKIDNQYTFRRRFEEEVPILLNQLMYPGANAINKSHLSTVGTQHKWPTLLGVLHWLMRLAQSLEAIDVAKETDNAVNYDDEAFNDISYCQYVQHRFSGTLQGLDETESIEIAESVLHNMLDQKFNIYEKENQQIEEEIEALNNELSDEKSKPNLRYCLDQLKLEKDRNEQFKNYLIQNNIYKERYLQDEIKRNEEYEQLEEDITQLDEKVAELQDTIDNQELSQAEIQQMISDRINLLNELESTRMTERTLETEVEQLEEERKIKANDLVVELKHYNQLLSDCGLVDEDGDLIEVTFNTSSEDRANMLNLEPIRDIEPKILDLTESYNQRQIETKTNSVSIQTQIQAIEMELDDLEFRKEQSQKAVEQKEQEYRDDKQYQDTQLKSLQDQINAVNLRIKQLQPKTKSDVLNAQGQLNKIKNDVIKLQRELDFRCIHLANLFKSANDQIRTQNNKIKQNLKALKIAVDEEYKDTLRQVEQINQTEAFEDIPLITPYKKRRTNFNLS